MSTIESITCRLAENPQIQVGVLEAGESHLDDPVVNTPGLSASNSSKSCTCSSLLGLWGDADGPEYDWGFSTTPQQCAGSRNISIPR